jgi:hypothetical protein
MEKRKMSSLTGFELQPSTVLPIANCYTECATLAPGFESKGLILMNINKFIETIFRYSVPSSQRT